MSEPLTKDKIVEGVMIAAEFNAAAITYVDRKQPPELEKEVFRLGQIEYFKVADVASAVRLLREKVNEENKKVMKGGYKSVWKDGFWSATKYFSKIIDEVLARWKNDVSKRL